MCCGKPKLLPFSVNFAQLTLSQGDTATSPFTFSTVPLVHHSSTSQDDGLLHELLWPLAPFVCSDCRRSVPPFYGYVSWVHLGLGVALTDVFYSEFQMKDRESRLMLVGFWRSRVRMLGLRQGLGCVSG